MSGGCKKRLGRQGRRGIWPIDNPGKKAGNPGRTMLMLNATEETQPDGIRDPNQAPGAGCQETNAVPKNGWKP